MWFWKARKRIFYERTELQGSALQWGLEGHGWVLHCSRSGGLSWISQLRSLKRSPFGRWHTTSLVLMPPPHGLVHWGQQERRKWFRAPHGFNHVDIYKIFIHTRRKEETRSLVSTDLIFLKVFTVMMDFQCVKQALVYETKFWLMCCKMSLLTITQIQHGIVRHRSTPPWGRLLTSPQLP